MSCKAINSSISLLPTKNRITILMRFNKYSKKIPKVIPTTFFLQEASNANTPAINNIMGSVPSHPNEIWTEKVLLIIISPTFLTPVVNKLIIEEEKKAVLFRYCSKI